MQGIPGSGKSTVAKAMAGIDGDALYSTDDYWMESGVYRYDVDRIGEAHAWNQSNARAAMLLGFPLVIIDNTNIKKRYAQPYLDLAQECGYPVQVVRVEVAVEEAIRRNNMRTEDRRIPEDVIRRMAAEMEDLLK